MQLFNFFGKIVNPKRQQEDKLFLQIRLVTPTPKDLPIPLQDIGKEFSELIEEKFQVKIFRNPYACQAAKTATIGWLWGSTKTMPDDKLMPAIRKQLGIPKEVAAGLQWRTIKEVTGRNYKWGENDAPPPQALHFDMDDDYAPLYAEKAAKFWRKHAKQKSLDYTFDLFPVLEAHKPWLWMTAIEKIPCYWHKNNSFSSTVMLPRLTPHTSKHWTHHFHRKMI